MSGAEAILVLGLLASIIGVVDYTGKALKRIREAKNDLSDVPEAFRSLQVILPALDDAVKKTRVQVENGVLGEDSCKVLRPMLEDFSTKIEELKDELRKCELKGDSRLARGWNAILSLTLDKKIEETYKVIRRHIQVLTLHHAINLSTWFTEFISAKLSATSLEASKRPSKFRIIPPHRSDISSKVQRR